MQPSMTRETVFVERRHPSVRWSAVLAGAAVSVGLWIFLQVLGMGIGLSAVDTDDAGSLRGAALGTGLWTAIAPILALFAGGLVAGRVSGVRDRVHNGLHGVIVWALALVIGVLALARVLGALSGAVTATGSVAARGATAVVGASGAAVDAGEALGLDADTLLGPVNARLREQGKPAVTADQLEAVAKDVAQRSVATGHLDRALLVDRLASRTALSRRDAEDVATQIEDQVDRVRDRVADAADTAEGAALTAADRTGKAMVWASLALLLGLGASIGGAVAGTYWRQRRRDDDGSPRTTREMWAVEPTRTP